MAKIVLLLTIGWMTILHADLQSACLACHQKHQIPSSLIYKRYLLKYSTKPRIEKAIFDYLKNPSQQTSIMPPPFFLKFPMKQPTDMTDNQLKKSIEAFVEYYDPRKRLVLEK